jgi:pentatricopeptide repeat protein
MAQSQRVKRNYIILLTFLCIQPTTSFQSSTPFTTTTTTTTRHTSIHRDAPSSRRTSSSSWFRDDDGHHYSSSSSLKATVDSSPYVDLRALEQKIVAFGRVGKIKQALQLYYEVERPSVRLMNGAIDACSRARPPRFRTAFDIFEAGVNSQNVRPNVFTFGALMNVCSRSHKADEAIRLLKTMQVCCWFCCTSSCVTFSCTLIMFDSRHFFVTFDSFFDSFHSFRTTMASHQMRLCIHPPSQRVLDVRPHSQERL